VGNQEGIRIFVVLRFAALDAVAVAAWELETGLPSRVHYPVFGLPLIKE
jgi:hypothetical protein